MKNSLYTPTPKSGADVGPRPFLGVQFTNCGVYGRLYRNKEGSAYVGRCPKCGRSWVVRIGSSGTNARFFQAYC